MRSSFSWFESPTAVMPTAIRSRAVSSGSAEPGLFTFASRGR